MAIVTRRYQWAAADLSAIKNNADPGASLPALGYQATVDVTFDDAVADPMVVDTQMQLLGFTFLTAAPVGTPQLTLKTVGATITNALSPYTVKTTDNYLFVDTSAGPVTLSLPDPKAFGYSKEYRVIDTKGTFATNNCTLDLLGRKTVLQTAWGGWTIVTDQVNWYQF